MLREKYLWKVNKNLKILWVGLFSIGGGKYIIYLYFNSFWK